MATELNVEGLDIAPGVVEQMVELAAGAVDGVASVATSPLGRIAKAAKSPKSTTVTVDENGDFAVSLHLTATYGHPLRQLGAAVQEAVSDALCSQTGRGASQVDVFIDAIDFPEQQAR